jgi:hypothetical protein
MKRIMSCKTEFFFLFFHGANLEQNVGVIVFFFQTPAKCGKIKKRTPQYKNSKAMKTTCFMAFVVKINSFTGLVVLRFRVKKADANPHQPEHA